MQWCEEIWLYLIGHFGSDNSSEPDLPVGPSYNLEVKARNSDWDDPRFPSVCAAKYKNSTWTHNVAISFHNLSTSFFTDHNTIRHYVLWATHSLVR